MKQFLQPSTLLLLASCCLLTSGLPAASFSQAVKKTPPSAKPSAPAAKKKEAAPKATYISYDEAKPILEAFQDALPTEFRTASSADLPKLWAKLGAARDAGNCSRL